MNRWIALYFLLLPCFAQGQFIISDILVSGNKKTKKEIILRELDFKKGDTISLQQLSPRLERNEEHIMNTLLFNSAEIRLADWSDTNANLLTLEIQVVESWYIYPFPIFELADRNFNVWWTEHNRDIKRVNFGIRFYHLNTSGHRDKLKVTAQLGYTQKFEVDYYYPTVNAAQTLGLIGNLFYSRNKEIGYETLNNKLEFYRDDDEFQLWRIRADIGISFRKKIYATHTAKIQLHQNRVSSFVADTLNPEFLFNGRTRQTYMGLFYEYIHDNRDMKPYPLKGTLLLLRAEKAGLGIFKDRNTFLLTAALSQYFPFGKKISLGIQTKGRVDLIRKERGYTDYTALGYGEDYVRGYEFYVIDGTDYLYFKSSLKIGLINRSFNFGKVIPLEAYRDMQFKLFLSLNSDFGLVNDPYFEDQNALSNRLLWGGGIGLDFILFFDKVIQFEYSFNHLWENGLFLHFNLSF